MKGRLFVMAGAALFASALRADHTDFVVINAAASKAYTQRKFVHGVAQPESYVFYEGKYFGGLTRDSSMVHTTFMDIARVLAPNLAKQNYLPTKNITGADLLIVVNWGTTVTDDTGKKSNPNSSFDLTDAYQSVMAYNAFVAGGEGMGTAGPTSGDSPSLTSAGQALDELTLDLMQNQAKAMSAQKFAESNAELLGYTHAMNKEAAGYFGKQLDDLMSAQTRVGKNSRVEIGPVKVLDVAKEQACMLTKSITINMLTM